MGLELFYSAFLDLDGDRPSGWSVRPIPWTIMIDYCQAYNIVDEQREDLLYLVRAMDRAYIKHTNQKEKKKKKK